MAKKILEWICPQCKKQIISVSEKQFDYNKDQHIQKHERQKNE